MPRFDSWAELKVDKLALLSAIGSLASIVALGLVLSEKATAGGASNPELAAWRVILFIVALVGSAGALLFTYFWVKDAAATSNSTPHRVVVRTTVRLVFGFLLIGACIDGLYAALYWNVWMSGILRLLRMVYESAY